MILYWAISGEGGILLANDRLDITKDVLKGLNEMDTSE